MAHGEHTAHTGGGLRSRPLPVIYPIPLPQQGTPSSRESPGRSRDGHRRLTWGSKRRRSRAWSRARRTAIPASTAPPPAFVSARARPGPFRTGYLATRPGSPAPRPAASQWVFIREATSLLAAANEMANVGGGGGGGGGGAGKMAVRRGLRRHRGCRAAAPLAQRSSVAASGWFP